jgi:SAM-dependent methyltransferase
MADDRPELLKEVASYYTEKLAEYGETPRGVDWNGSDSQLLRVEQLCKVVTSATEAFSVNDLGCGYGALLEYLTDRRPLAAYCGIDLSDDMVRAARARHRTDPRARFTASSKPDASADYGIASGIFNVRLDRSDEEWRDYIQTTLSELDRTSRVGFAFNCLTSYSDEDKKRGYLYYAHPCELFDLCKRRYSRQVALLHDYGLYEFTILVRKSL